MNQEKQPEALTKERLHELFDYQDGALINKTIRRSQVKIGQPAGGIDCRGYIKFRVDGRMYRAHRLIFLYHHGYFPEIVDHIDCNRTNNRIENLRAATKSENGMNRSGSYGSAMSRNVYRRSDKFQVHMKSIGKTRYVGTFKTLAEANEAAVAVRKELFGAFA